MDKRTLIGLVLMGILFFGAMYTSQPTEKEIRMRQQQDSIAALVQASEEKKAEQKEQQLQASKEALADDSTAIFFAHRRGTAEDVTLDNGKVKVTLSTKGATPKQAEILGYKSHGTGNDVILFNPEDAHMNIALAGKQDNIITEDFYFTPTAQTETSVTLSLQQESKSLDITYTLLPESYLMNVEIQAQGMSGFFAPNMNTLAIDWKDHICQQEKGYDFENRYSSLTYKIKEKGTKELSETSDEEKTPEETLDWVAFKNQFFSAVLIAPQDLTSTHLKSTQEKEQKNGYLKTYEAQMNTFFDPSGREATKLQMYLGPNDFHLLQAHNDLCLTDKDLEMEELVDLGWPIMRWINRWFILPIFDWLTGFGMNMGLVLLLLTVIVKVVVYPTQKKSFISSTKMRVLKPQIDALNAKYPKQEDAMKKQQEMMQIYNQYGVSPMGGCLPMLIQMPIWIALFNFVPNAIELRGQSFLWAEDLSAYDDLINWGSDIWLLGDHLSIFCVLFCLTNIINTWISMRQQKDQMSGEQAQQMKMMQYMMYVMPLMFFFMFNNYSSGLCYYYFLSGLTNILTMWYLRKTTDEKKILAKLEAYREQHKNDPKKMSNMAARLEALQKMQEMKNNQR